MKLLLLPLLFVVVHAAPRMRFVEAGRDGKLGPVLTDGAQFCPDSFSSRGFSVRCEMNSPSVSFIVDGRTVRVERVKPFVLNGDSNGLVFAYKFVWGTHKIACVGSDNQRVEHVIKFGCPPAQSKPVPPPPVPVTPQRATTRNDAPEPENDSRYPVKKEYCVTRKGTDHVNKRPGDWVQSGTALTYRPDDYDKHKTVGASTAVLTYEFKVAVESTYGVVVDMETRDWTEFNDVFVSCDGGVTLRRGSKLHVANGPVKAYHNEKGRRKISSSVDFDPHAISTKMKLRPGVVYRCRVHARSTRTTVHGLILFPCWEDECNENSPKWRHYLGVCHV